ncbi:hypothetical protein EV126DRAFT_222168 [Verticillium dahliae]|nr:hypothetical protein EV126DRAFT_164507 [Verticillium dahliae]KAH6702215.1 hypothetical protein EV126DRAFT_222168 [Verticillium dahliae]
MVQKNGKIGKWTAASGDGKIAKRGGEAVSSFFELLFLAPNGPVVRGKGKGSPRPRPRPRPNGKTPRQLNAGPPVITHHVLPSPLRGTQQSRGAPPSPSHPIPSHPILTRSRSVARPSLTPSSPPTQCPASHWNPLKEGREDLTHKGPFPANVLHVATLTFLFSTLFFLLSHLDIDPPFQALQSLVSLRHTNLSRHPIDPCRTP